jgi:hypothetical protein
MFSIPSNSFGNEVSSIAETITNGHLIRGSSIVDMIMYDQAWCIQKIINEDLP